MPLSVSATTNSRDSLNLITPQSTLNGIDGNGRKYRQVQYDDCKTLEYNTIIGPIIGIFRLIYGVLQFSCGVSIFCFAPYTGGDMIVNGTRNFVRGTIGSIPIFGGLVLRAYDTGGH